MMQLNDEIKKFTKKEQLQKIKETMEKYDCDTLKCCGEYTYDFSDVEDAIDTLETFENISEIMC